MWTLSQTAPSLPVACRMVGDRKLGALCMGMRLLRLYLVCSKVPYVALFSDLLKVNCLIIYSTEVWETFT